MLNDPETVELLKANFIPFAIDNVDHPQLTPPERAFLKDKGLDFSTQGMSVFTAGGKVLAKGGGFEAAPVRQMLRKALKTYVPEEGPAVEPPAGDAAADSGSKDLPPVRRPPEGGLVLYVTWKVLWDPAATVQSSATTGDGTYDQVFKRAVGVDRLWVRRDEADALARGEFADSLVRRMTPHVGYVFSGENHQADLTVRDGRISGTLTPGADGGGPVGAEGVVETRDGRVTRLELLLTGPGDRKEDFGFAAGLTVVPKGKTVPVALLFELADPTDDLARTPPHRCGGADYLR